MFSLAAGHFQRDDPSRTAIWKPDNWTNSWKVEQEEEEEDNLSPPSTSSTSSSILIPSESCELAGLLCPRWPVVNPGVQQQATSWLRRVGTSKNGPHSNSASQARGVHAVRCVPLQPSADEPAPQMCAGSWAEGCVFLQPGHCVDSKSQWRWWWWWWFTGLIQRLFTHKWKPCGGGEKKTEKSELPLGRNVWLFSPAAKVLSALYESPISENFMMLLEKNQKQKKAQQICSHAEQLKFPPKWEDDDRIQTNQSLHKGMMLRRTSHITIVTRDLSFCFFYCASHQFQLN